MKKAVISLGGSLIIPESVDFKFLNKFRTTLKKHYSHCKFIVVCGGGTIARRYIDALKKEHRSKNELSLVGIRTTRMNALFMTQFFGKEANSTLPKNIKEVKNMLEKNKVVLCGALRYSPNATSDTTAAKIAHEIGTDFINITNIDGLYSKNPKKNKDAVFIKRESWEKFHSRAIKIKHRPGQHFVLDQTAAIIIKKYRIKTYIIGKNLKNLDAILHNKKFKGTLIAG